MSDPGVSSSVPAPARLPGCPARVRLQAFAAREAAEPELGTHLSSCEGCRAYVDALREARHAFQLRRPPAMFIGQLEARRHRQRRPRWLRLGLPALGLYLAASFALLMAAPPNGSRGKGGALRVVYRRGDAEAVPVTQEIELHPRDALRFSYAAHPAGYFAVLDIDGTGKITVFYPYGGAWAAPLSAGDSTWLPGSVVLDGAPGPDWLVAVFKTEPFELAPLTAELTTLARGAPPRLQCGNCRVETLRINKKP